MTSGIRTVSNRESSGLIPPGSEIPINWPKGTVIGAAIFASAGMLTLIGHLCLPGPLHPACGGDASAGVLTEARLNNTMTTENTRRARKRSENPFGIDSVITSGGDFTRGSPDFLIGNDRVSFGSGPLPIVSLRSRLEWVLSQSAFEQFRVVF